jgi:chitin synthase
MMAPFVSCLPIQAPNSFYTALEVVRAFTHCVTPFNPSFPRYSSLAATFSLNLLGEITGASLALSKSGIDTENGLTQIPSGAGYRAFDVFYYLNVSSATKGEREFLNLKPSKEYTFLKRSGTVDPPSYVPTADDAAAAEDFRNNLKAIGIKGKDRQSLISALTAILKLGDATDFLADAEEIMQEVKPLLDIESDVVGNLSTHDLTVFIRGLYEALVDWVIARANETMRQEVRASRAMGSQSGEASPVLEDDDGDTVDITVISIPSQDLGKAVAMRTVFDDTEGINAEMKEDGVPITSAGVSVLGEMKAAVKAVEPDLGIMQGVLGREREKQRDYREGVLETFVQECTPDSYLADVLHPVPGQGVLLGTAGRFELANVLASSRVWFHLNIHPTDDGPASLANPTGQLVWSASAASRQLRAWRLPEWANRRNRALDYTADFDFDEFSTRYSRLGCKDGRDGVESWLVERGWCNGEVVVGKERVWIREASWWEAETMLDAAPPVLETISDGFGGPTPLESGYSVQSPGLGSGFFGPPAGENIGSQGSRDHLLDRHQSTYTLGNQSALGGKSLAPTNVKTARSISGGGDYGLGSKGDVNKNDILYEGQLDPELGGEGKVVIEKKQSVGRKMWLAVVWGLTFWIPSPLLRYVGRMKRPDVRLAWREKVVLMFMILLINAAIVAYIIGFGKLLCPNQDKAWNAVEVSYHQGADDFWVSHRGFVFDLSKFWKTQHSDTAIETTTDNMQPFAGMNMDEYIKPPLTLACPLLVKDDTMTLLANTTVQYPQAIHTTGPTLQTDPTTKLHDIHWYTNTFLPKMMEFKKGQLVWAKTDLKSQGQNQQRQWFILNNEVFDLTDYFYSKKTFKGDDRYAFFNSDFTTIVQENAGLDISSDWANLNSTVRDPTLNCLKNYFYIGVTDFRLSARCQVNKYILLAVTIILCVVILTKFLAALQLGSKRRPAPQDKFVIAQVPAYTEGEDQLRKSLDSLTALAYDNKRKLICVICDGVIVGHGNDRPTPKIVLDILGVDPKLDPPALPFKSIGVGSEILNYGKVYSGLYEFEGNVVPYIVVVKMGKESEQAKSKPGNRGKRDSQILLMQFLNRVHHRSPMSPLELEMFHQINNVIGVDPELYEYLLMVDADTNVKEDSLNRLVAACANDAKIAGICGETSLENEERSWWTMIQVYEYYISHHLAKAFESLFGSVTCLPGW